MYHLQSKESSMQRLSVICLALCLVSGAFAKSNISIIPIEPDYPYMQVTPKKPVAGEATTLRLILGMHTNGCVPEYSSVQYVIMQRPEKIYPPRYDLDIFYTERWPKQEICTAVMMEYGPSVTVAADDVHEGTYFVKCDGEVVGTFLVSRPAIISGTVTDDPGVTYRATLPIANAKVYLQKLVEIFIQDPYPPVLYKKASEPAPLQNEFYYAIDSTLSTSEGVYRFSHVIPGDYRLVAVADGFVTEASRAYIARDTVIDFMLDADIDTGSAETIIVDGVAFTVRTDRKSYTTADSIRVSYAVTNNSMATVRYDFTSGCQFNMTLADSNGSLYYRYLDNRACTDALTAITLAPGESTTFSYQPFWLKSLFASQSRPPDTVMRVRAFMAGYPGSAVTTRVGVLHADAVSANEPPAHKGRAPRFAATRAGVSLSLDHPQTVSLEAFLPTGRRLEKLSHTATLGAGDHFLPFAKSAINSPVIFRLKTDQSTVTRTVVLN